MKKILVLLPMSLILIVTIALFKVKENSIEYTSLSKSQLPIAIRKDLQKNPDDKFTIYNDEKFTYVLYKAEHKTNEYMNTDLKLTKQNGNYVVNAIIDKASDETNVSYDKIIRFKKVPQNDIELNEIDKR
ncbi:hypothetical protein [Mesobacillus jeotgali]|uniref:hypothetical protein n=1 Tax=Mesobacillus jeotgali TaxID=129985 RepID=UPI000C83D2F2|nr:hypothetical protein [Mesobacillus jeotgali]